MDKIINLRQPTTQADNQFTAENILRTIAESSEKLLKVNSLYHVIDEILANIGETSDVSRVYIFKIVDSTKDDAIVSLCHEWTAPNIKAQINNAEFQNVSRKKVGLGRWTNKLKNGEVISGNIQDFAKPEKRFLKTTDIKSIAVVPIHTDDHWWGYIGFDECRWERNWSANSIHLLKSVAAMFGAAIEGENARKALKESEELFRSTFEKTAKGVVHIDKNLKFLRTNEKCCEILGYKKNELLYKSIQDIAYKGDQNKIIKILYEISQADNKSKLTQEAQIRLIKKDKSIVWIHITFSKVQNKNNTVKCFIGVFLDITKRLKTEQALQKSKERYQNLVDTVDDIIWSADKNFCWTFLNPASYEILGYAPEELIGTPCINIFASYEPLTMDDVYEQIRNHGRARYEINVISKDNKHLILDCNAILTRDQNGKIIGATGTARDITERTLAEKALRESEERFQIVSRATNDIIWDWNIDKNTFWSNLSIQTVFGYDDHNIEAKFDWWKQQIHPADRKRVITEIFNLMENKRSFWTSEFRFKYGNGSYANVLDRGYIIYDDKQNPTRMIGNLQDITDQKRYEQNLKDSRERLRNLASREQTVREEERIKLSRELHDEFAQILTALKMDLNWFKRKLPDDLKLLHERTSAMSNIIDTTMTRVRQIATELRPALLDDLGLSAAIDWQVKQFYARTGCKYSLDINIEDHEFNDELEIAIFRIFQEALSNIARHTNASFVEVSLTKENHEIVLRVVDNGGGIAEDKIQHMNSLGLTSMRERAGAFGGRLHIQTKLGLGTAITLNIPSPH